MIEGDPNDPQVGMIIHYTFDSHVGYYEVLGVDDDVVKVQCMEDGELDLEADTYVINSGWKILLDKVVNVTKVTLPESTWEV